MEVKTLRDNINLVGRSTIEDIECALDRLGYADDDFEFKVEDKTDYTPDLHHIYSAVHVTYKPRGIKRSYDAGHQTAFAAAFEQDLQSGVFK